MVFGLLKDSKNGEYRTIATPGEIASLLRVPLLGAVPEEDKLYLDNIAERSRPFREIASRLLGAETPVRRKLFCFGRKR